MYEALKDNVDKVLGSIIPLGTNMQPRNPGAYESSPKDQRQNTGVEAEGTSMDWHRNTEPPGNTSARQQRQEEQGAGHARGFL